MHRIAYGSGTNLFEEHEIFLQIYTTSERPNLNRKEYSVTTEKPLDEVFAAPAAVHVAPVMQPPKNLCGERQEREQ